jgi:hypothetical protein
MPAAPGSRFGIGDSSQDLLQIVNDRWFSRLILHLFRSFATENPQRSDLVVMPSDQKAFPINTEARAEQPWNWTKPSPVQRPFAQFKRSASWG